MKRGDLAPVITQSNQSNPRPALIIQADHFGELDSVTVLPLSSNLVDAPLMRITLEPNAQNSLDNTAQIMLDKTMTIKRHQIQPAFGKIDNHSMLQIERHLAVFLGIAK